LQNRGLEVARPLVAEHRRVEAAIDIQIDQLVHAGVGWPAIAEVLEVSRQAARQRHQRRVETALEAALELQDSRGRLPSTTM
jgi:hypothetical protein